MYDLLLLESILDKTTSFLCLTDAEGTIINIGSSFARLLSSKSRESLIGLKGSDAASTSAELRSFFLSLEAGNNDTAIPTKIVQPIHRNSEKPIWIKFDVSRFSTPEFGLITFISGSDITEEIVARRKSEQKAHERDSFLVRMGHELRTPLNTVLGYAQLLNGLEGLSPVAREYATTIISNEYTLLHLLNDVLELSKYESGQTVPVVAPTNIKKLINEVFKSYIDQFNAKYLSLTVTYKNDIPEGILTDSQKVILILTNIIGNALKFTRKGGVTITVSFDRSIIIDIEDTGIGIEPDEQSTIFEIFGQSGNSKEHMTGTGIGLYIARIFARMLDGDIALVYSKPGIGSLFRFTIAAKDAHTETKDMVQILDYSKINGISKPCKVLLVDDVDINLAMLEIFLAPAGFEVSIAANGNEALEQFKTFKPDIVFMDLIMPEKDGFEATREIKQLNSTVPVIALTASIVDSIKEQALAAGVNDFMNKPFVPERFFEIIAEYTGVEYLIK